MALGSFEWLAVVVLLAMPILWKSSHTLRFYVKIVAYNIWVIICTSLVLPVAFFRPRNVDNLRFIQRIMNFSSDIFGLSQEVQDIHYLDSDKPRVIVCNHQSSLDVLNVMKVLPRYTTAMMKKQLLYAGPFGVTCWLCGVIFVDRAGRGQGHKVTEGAAKVMKDKNVNVWIFPEGTRNYKDELLPFKKGAFYLAIQAQAPVCPVVISSYKNFLDKKNKVFTSGKVLVKCLPPISTVGLTVDDVEELTERVRSMMIKTYIELSQEVGSMSKCNDSSRVESNGGVKVVHSEVASDSSISVSNRQHQAEDLSHANKPNSDAVEPNIMQAED